MAVNSTGHLPVLAGDHFKLPVALIVGALSAAPAPNFAPAAVRTGSAAARQMLGCSFTGVCVVNVEISHNLCGQHCVQIVIPICR